MIFVTKDVFIHFLGRKKHYFCGQMVLETGLCTPWSWQRNVRNLAFRWHRLKICLSSQCGSAFASHTVEGCPIFPTLEYVCHVNLQLFLTLSQVFASCKVLCQEFGWWCCRSIFPLPSGHLLAPLISRWQRGRIFHQDINTHLSAFRKAWENHISGEEQVWVLAFRINCHKLLWHL